MAENNLKWSLISGVIALVVFILGTLAVGYIQDKQPLLNYLTYETIPFNGEGANLAIYYVIISNNGKTTIEDITGQISLPLESTLNTKVINEPTVIIYNGSIKDNTYTITYSSLNPGEKSIISILGMSKGPLPTRPEVSLRGKGIKGTEYLAASNDKNKYIIMIIAIISIIISFIFFSFKQKRVVGDIDEEHHSDDQKMILAYLSGINNLPNEVKRYTKLSTQVSYWSESDRLAQLAIINPKDKELNEKRKRLLINLLDYAQIAPKSKGIIHYNIARIAKIQENSSEVDEHLKEAKKTCSKLVEKRMSLEPLWKVK